VHTPVASQVNHLNIVVPSSDEEHLPQLALALVDNDRSGRTDGAARQRRQN
jgi:hypothetical protein